MKFTPDQFTPTQWETAEEKAKWANTFLKFLEGGCQHTQFTKYLYKRLCMMFGHIAHYNYRGFMDEWFIPYPDLPPIKERYIAYILSHPCYGDPAWTWSDVEKAIQKALQ